MTEKQQELEEYIDIRKEVKKFHGIEYELRLCTLKSEAVMPPEADKEAVEKNQWWICDSTKKSGRLSAYAAKDFLWYDTRFMLNARMKDKYHYCELHAMNNITWLLDNYYWQRSKWIANELKCYFYVLGRIFFPRLIFKVGKLFKGADKIEIPK